MSSILEKLSGLVVPDKDSGKPSKPPVPEVPSIAELVRKQMERHNESQNPIVSQAPTPANTNSGPVSAVEEIPPIPQKTNTLSPTKSEMTPALPNTVIASPDHLIAASTENMGAPEKSEWATGVSVEELAQAIQDKRILGREFLDIYLREVVDLISAGEKLHELQEERNQNRKLSEGIKANLLNLQDKGKMLYADIQSTLATISKDDSGEAPSILQNSISKYGEYLQTFESALGDVFGAQIKKDNQLLVEIQKRRSEIKHLTELVGGSSIFNSIKDTIIKTETVIKRYYIRELQNMYRSSGRKFDAEELQDVAQQMFGETIGELFDTIKPAVSGDSGIRMLVQTPSMNIGDVIRAIVLNKVEERNKNLLTNDKNE